ARAPPAERLELDEDLEVVGQGGVGPVLGPAELGEQLGHLGSAGQALLDPRGELASFRERDVAGQGEGSVEGPLVQLRQELRAEAWQQGEGGGEAAAGEGED